MEIMIDIINRKNRDEYGRFVKSHTPWNTGLTKEVEPRLAEVARKTSLAQKGISEKKEVVERMTIRIRQMHIDRPELGKLCRRKQLEKRWLDPEQHEKASKRTKGFNNYFWKGGHSRVYGEEFTPYLKIKVKIRDGWKCTSCAAPRKDNVLDIHHIDGDKLNNSMDNLISLCKSCHGKVQKKSFKLGGDSFVKSYQK